MNYIVLDLEWNQGERSKKSSPLSFEIIEIGATKLNDKLEPIEEFHRIIRPVIHPKLFSFTKKLLPLTEEDLQQGIPFKKACTDFLKWCKKDGDYTFATWGTLDLYELQRNMEFYKIKNPFERPLRYIDVQQLYSIHFGKAHELPVSLENASATLNIPQTEVFHSAKNDAFYAAQILRLIPLSVIERYPAVDVFKFPIYKKQEAYIMYPDHSIYVSRAYKTKEALKLASALRPLYCPICNKKAHRSTSWVASTTKSFYMLGKCREHGYLKAKRIIKNPAEKRFFETISIKPITKEEKEHFLTSCKTKSEKKNKLR